MPIDAFEGDFHRLLECGPVVITAPTGTGKSTQVPRWAASRGPVLVVEPRRVACQVLAHRVGELEAQASGYPVGFVVRDERTAGDDTRIVFATPGVVLRLLAADGLSRFATVIIDEFHERSLDTDLIFALCVRAGMGPSAARSSPAGNFPPGADPQTPRRLVVMSATVAGERIAQHMQGAHLAVEEQAFPVRCEYVPGNTTFPETSELDDRLRAALGKAVNQPGDVLVFLPGKREIERALRLVETETPYLPLPLHGGLSLQAQRAVLRESGRRRAILATNVAETSLTVPGIGVVIDSGLVRRTHYRGGRGYLGLAAIAADSAEQRRGRAGRLGPGVCYRLWARGARLEAVTPPEIYRESLVPLVLAAAACRAQDTLPYLNPPAEHAVTDARAVLYGLGALDGHGQITRRGTELFRLPIDAPLGRVLIEARARGTLPMAVPLVAALTGPRPLFNRISHGGVPGDEDECDARAAIEAMARARPSDPDVDAGALSDARALARRLQALWPDSTPTGEVTFDRHALAATLLAAWPGCAYVARRRGRRVAWSNGGTEAELARESRVNAQKAEVIIGLDIRALSEGRSRNALRVTQAMPIPAGWLDEAGLTRLQIRGTRLRRNRIVIEADVVYAGKVIARREQHPTGAVLREAICELFLAGRLFESALEAARDRHALRSLHASFAGVETPAFRDWLLDHLAALGVETEADWACLEASDLMPDPLPPREAQALERTHPRRLSVGNIRYQIRYDVPARVATLVQIAGGGTQPPSLGFLPRLPGWRIDWEYKNRTRRLRG